MEKKKHIVAVTALVQHPTEKKFLILKRAAHEVGYPGKWAFPGGKVERGQTLFEALREEVREEIGLEIGEEKKYLYNFTLKSPKAPLFRVEMKAFQS